MGGQIRVAYVEDEPSIARLLEQGLALFGIVVQPVYKAAEEFLRNSELQSVREANMLVFDIRLPGMTGLELARKLRQHGEERPFLLVSAWPAPSREELDSVQAAFLPKPFDFAAVVQTIQKLL